MAELRHDPSAPCDYCRRALGQTPPELWRSSERILTMHADCAARIRLIRLALAPTPAEALSDVASAIRELAEAVREHGAREETDPARRRPW